MKQTGSKLDAPAPKTPTDSILASINVTRIALMLTHSTDLVFIETDLPPTVWPFEAPATLKVEVAKNKGYDWIEDAFGDELEYEIIDVRGTPKK